MVMWAMKASLGYNGTWTAVLYSSCCCLCIGRWQFSLPLEEPVYNWPTIKPSSVHIYLRPN